MVGGFYLVEAVAQASDSVYSVSVIHLQSVNHLDNAEPKDCILKQQKNAILQYNTHNHIIKMFREYGIKISHGYIYTQWLLSMH